MPPALSTCVPRHPIHIALAVFLAGTLLSATTPPGGEDSVDPEAEGKPPLPRQSDEDDEAPAQTVVIATRHPESPYDIPMSTTAVDHREILEKNPRTAAEALRRKPGIWIQKTGHLGGAPVLRGFMGNRVVYLFDGIRRNTAGLFKGPNSFLQNIDALDIDRIEVVRGPGSVLYGSDAIGGVLNVITNEEPLFSDASTWGGRLYSRFGSVDREISNRAEASFSNEDLYAFAGVSYRDIDDVRAGRGLDVQSPSAWRESNWDAQVDYRLDRKSSVELFVQDFSRPKGRRFDRPNWKQENDRELIGLRYEARDVGFADDLEVTTYWHDQEGFIDEKFWDSDTDEETLGLDAQATSFLGDDLRLTYGVHYHHDDIVKSNPQKGTEDPDVEWDNPAGFVLSEWQATDRLRIDAGARVDSFGLTSNAPPLGMLPQEIQDAIASGSFSLADLELVQVDIAVTGGVGAVYALTDEFNVVAHVGRAFRAPNKSDMLSFGQFTFGFSVPSPDLDPESSWTYELGLNRRTEDFSGSVTGFYTEIEDAIFSTPGTFNGQTFIDVDGNGIEDPGEQVFVNANSGGTVKATGVELELRQWLPESWNRCLLGEGALSWYGNFSWIYGEDTGNNEPLDRAYPANGLIGVRLDETRDPRESRYWVEAEAWIVRNFHRIPSTRQFSDPAFHVDPQDKTSPLLGGTGNVPGFQVVNVRGGYRVGEGVTLSMGVENLFDKLYRAKDSRIDGPGLTVLVGVDVVL